MLNWTARLHCSYIAPKCIPLRYDFYLSVFGCHTLHWFCQYVISANDESKNWAKCYSDDKLSSNLLIFGSICCHQRPVLKLSQTKYYSAGSTLLKLHILFYWNSFLSKIKPIPLISIRFEDFQMGCSSWAHILLIFWFPSEKKSSIFVFPCFPLRLAYLVS